MTTREAEAKTDIVDDHGGETSVVASANSAGVTSMDVSLAESSEIESTDKKHARQNGGPATRTKGEITKMADEEEDDEDDDDTRDFAECSSPEGYQGDCSSMSSDSSSNKTASAKCGAGGDTPSTDAIRTSAKTTPTAVETALKKTDASKNAASERQQHHQPRRKQTRFDVKSLVSKASEAQQCNDGPEKRDEGRRRLLRSRRSRSDAVPEKQQQHRSSQASSARPGVGSFDKEKETPSTARRKKKGIKVLQQPHPKSEEAEHDQDDDDNYYAYYNDEGNEPSSDVQLLTARIAELMKLQSGSASAFSPGAVGAAAAAAESILRHQQPAPFYPPTPVFPWMQLIQQSAMDQQQQHQPPQLSETAAAAAAAAAVAAAAVAPQWNGVRVRNPMDPRIDLQSVPLVSASQYQTGNTSNESSDSQQNNTSDNTTTSSSGVLSNEHYLNLLAACRPFFLGGSPYSGPTLTDPGGLDAPAPSAYSTPQAHGYFPAPAMGPPTAAATAAAATYASGLPVPNPLVSMSAQVLSDPAIGIPPFATAPVIPTTATDGRPRASTAHKGSSGSEEQISSSGMTSFFTSTQNESGESSSSIAAEGATAKGTHRAVAEDNVKKNENKNKPKRSMTEDGCGSDSSSLVVLARVKRKHMQRAPAEDSVPPRATEEQEHTSRTLQENFAAAQRQGASSQDSEDYEDARQKAPSPTDGVGGVSDLSSGSNNEGNVEAAPTATAATMDKASSRIRSDTAVAKEEGMTSADPKAATTPPTTKAAPGTKGGGARVISDFSSESRVQASSTTGSSLGDAATTSLSAAEENRRHGKKGRQPDISEAQSVSSDKAVIGSVPPPSPPMTGQQTPVFMEAPEALSRKTADTPTVKAGTADSTVVMGHVGEALDVSGGPDDIAAEQEAALTEERLHQKKRKRMNKRREFEEELEKRVQGSSDSIKVAVDTGLKPGVPVLLEDVLLFTKTPRLIIQATLPFRAVHANAAFTALTGIDSHAAVGKPVSALLVLPRNSNGNTGSADGGTLSSLSGSTSMPGSGSAGSPLQQQQQVSATGAKPASASSATPGEINMDMASPSGDGGGNGAGGNSNTNDAAAVAAVAAGQARAAAVMEEDPVNLGLERLLLMSGFGRYHKVRVTAKPDHMGTNVSFLNQAGSGAGVGGTGGGDARLYAKGDDKEEGSHDSSLPSSENPFFSVRCRMCVCPVVSSTAISSSTTQEGAATVAEQTSHLSSRSKKRRKEVLLGASGTGTTTKKRGATLADVSDTHLPQGRRTRARSLQQVADGQRQQQQQHNITHYVIQLDSIDGGRGGHVGVSSSGSMSTTSEAKELGVTVEEARSRRDLHRQQLGHHHHHHHNQHLSARQAETGRHEDETSASSSTDQHPLVACA